tara:strand:+ start:3672 stop:5237 length:1566 start_codon:yes stop_codon:yes gene_type:complete
MSLEQSVAENTNWINSVISKSKLASQLEELTEITSSSEHVTIQEGINDAKFVTIPKLRGFKGSWNALTNTPTLIDGVGVSGDIYSVTTAFTRNLGDGEITFSVDDLMYYTDSKWINLTGSSNYSFFASYTGTMQALDLILTLGDYRANADSVRVIIDIANNLTTIDSDLSVFGDSLLNGDLGVSGDILANNFSGTSEGANTGDQDLSDYVKKDEDSIIDGGLEAVYFEVTGATSSQFLKGDGTLDSSTYLLNTTDTLTGDLKVTSKIGINTGSSPLSQALTVLGGATFDNTSMVVLISGDDGANSIIHFSDGSGDCRIGSYDSVFTIAADDGFIVSTDTSSGLDVNVRMKIDNSGNTVFTGENFTIGDASTTNTSKLTYTQQGVGLYSGTLSLHHSTSNSPGSYFQAFTINGTVIGAIVQQGSNGVNYSTNSDYRLKEDLKDFNAIEMILNIPIYDYKWKIDGTRSYGVMAHELQAVLPNAVIGEKDEEEMQSVDYSKIVPLLVKSIQELSTKVERLELSK